MLQENKKIVQTATDALKFIWEIGFLKSWKKLAQFEEKFSQKGYHFSNAELGMALKRAKYLTRRGGRGNYEYIQKYPYVNDKKEK
jgi:hypothetical protein